MVPSTHAAMVLAVWDGGRTNRQFSSGWKLRCDLISCARDQARNQAGLRPKSRNRRCVKIRRRCGGTRNGQIVTLDTTYNRHRSPHSFPRWQLIHGATIATSLSHYSHTNIAPHKTMQNGKFLKPRQCRIMGNSPVMISTHVTGRWRCLGEHQPSRYPLYPGCTLRCT